MKKLILLASLLGSVACHMPPETQPRPVTRIIYIYETSRYPRDYGYNSRYDDCWMRMGSFYCGDSRYRSGIYLPMNPFPGNRMNRPALPNRNQPQPPRTGPQGQRPQTPRVGPPPGRPQMPGMGPRGQGMGQGRPMEPRGEPRRAEPRFPQQPPRAGPPRKP